MIKRKLVAAIAAVPSLLFCNPQSHAAHLGLSTQLHTTVNVGGSLRAGYRVYAAIGNPNDYLTSVSGSDANGPLVLQSLNGAGTVPGGDFFDSASGTPGSMTSSASAAAIGVFMASDPLLLTGNSYEDDNAVWFTLGPTEQGRAGGPNGEPIVFNGVPSLGVLLMQLAVPAGDNVAGTLNVVSLEGSGGTTIAGETFTSVIPAPASIILLGFFGLMRLQRSRRDTLFHVQQTAMCGCPSS